MYLVRHTTYTLLSPWQRTELFVRACHSLQYLNITSAVPIFNFFLYIKSHFCVPYKLVYIFQLISSGRETLPDPINQMCGPVLVTRFPIKIHIYSYGNIGKPSSLSDTDINFVIKTYLEATPLQSITRNVKVPVAVGFSVASNEQAGYRNWRVGVNSTVHLFYRCVITKHCEAVSSLHCQEIAHSFCYGTLRINTIVTRGQRRTTSVHSLSLDASFILFSH